MMTPLRRDSATARSMYDWSVTQTGQPGPLTSLRLPGSIARSPARAMAMVCVPQTSMICIRRSGGSRLHRSSILWRYSSMRASMMTTLKS